MIYFLSQFNDIIQWFPNFFLPMVPFCWTKFGQGALLFSKYYEKREYKMNTCSH